MSSRCTRKRMYHRVGPSGSPSTSRTGPRTRSDRRGCSKNRGASPSRTREHRARSAVIFMVLLVVGATALLSLKAIIFPGGGSAMDATGEEVSFSSKSGISELPKTGGP